MDIRKELQSLADPQRAAGEKKYLKSTMRHYGVTVPMLHKLAQAWVKENQVLSIDNVIIFTDMLWAGDFHEERWLATDILTLRRSDLTLEHFHTVEHMVRTAMGWAQLDNIAAWLVGTLYEKYPHEMAEVFRRWILDPNFWVRRAALLGQLIPFRHGKGDFALFTELASTQLGEKEFFIRKAIGWVLRDVSRREPKLTFGFVRRYGLKMSPLTYREAVRRLPLDMQVRLVGLLGGRKSVS